MSEPSVWIIESKPKVPSMRSDREWAARWYLGAYAEKGDARRAFPLNPQMQFRAVRYVRAPQKKVNNR